ncbi:type VI secretion system baseplate subunit TssG [bacterium]|nr:type VI secretion system baseplate subunit TssG [bacterium]
MKPVEHIMPDFCSRRHPFHITTALVTLMKLGIEPVNINMLAVGHYENYRGEVHQQEPKPGTPLTPQTRVTLHVGADSAVDTLPYQFFYGISGATNRSSQWDEESRRLLAPFDAAVERMEGRSEFLAMQYRQDFIDRSHISRFFDLFGFASKEAASALDDRLMWTALLPTFHFWAGNPVFVEKAVSLFFNYPCHITENIPARFEIPEELHYHLGNPELRLGQETTIGDSFVECDSCYLVTLSNVAPNDVPDFLPEKPLRKRLEAILKVCMPGDLDYRLRILTRRSGFRLGAEPKAGYLGYTSHV